jgi:hypothetical protein
MQEDRMARSMAFLSFLLIVTSAGLLAAPASQPADIAVLDGKSSWRCFTQLRTEVLQSADGRLKSVRVRGQRGILPLPATQEQTAEPPANWAASDFDDSGRARYVGQAPSGSRELAVRCIRGEVSVTDPGRVKSLTLSLGYRGGAVVYLNGRKLTRGNLPHGMIDAEALAESYPTEGYLRPDNRLPKNGFGDPERLKDRFASRTRRLDNVAVPGNLLRKGVNVQAIELHRAPTAEVLRRAPIVTMGEFQASGWQDQSRQLLALAARVADKLN